MNKLFLLLLLLSSRVFADDYCEAMNATAQLQAMHIDNAESGYRVEKYGRLYFHSAPDEKCIIKRLFIIYRDNLDASLEYNGYYYVIYFKGSGEQIEGWVKGSRLVSTRTGVGPGRP